MITIILTTLFHSSRLYEILFLYRKFFILQIYLYWNKIFLRNFLEIIELQMSIMYINYALVSSLNEKKNYN